VSASTPRRDWLEIGASILYFALAIFNAIRFWHRHESLDAVSAGLWFAGAVVFAFRSKHEQNRGLGS